MSVGLEVVTKIERLRELAEEWSGKVCAAEGTTPFQSPEWLLTWWQHFGSGELQSLVAWNRGSIAALLPCFRHVWEGARQLTLIGSGITDYLDPYFAPELVEEAVQAFAKFLEESEYDLCAWQDLSDTTPLRRLSSLASLDVNCEPDMICSETELGKDFGSYWQSLSSDMRRNVRRYSDKAEQEGRLSFEVDRIADRANLDALLSLHTLRWKERGESGMVEANQSAEFTREVAAAFARRDACRLFLLRWNDNVVAAILAFSWQGKLYGYFSAFDPQYERLGFGRILLSRCMRYAVETGHTHWNFLRGDEAYKRSWGAITIPKCRLTIRPRATGGKR